VFTSFQKRKAAGIAKTLKIFAVPGFVSNESAIASRGGGPKNPQQQEGEGGSRAERERVQI